MIDNLNEALSRLRYCSVALEFLNTKLKEKKVDEVFKEVDFLKKYLATHLSEASAPKAKTPDFRKLFMRFVLEHHKPEELQKFLLSFGSEETELILNGIKEELGPEEFTNLMEPK